MNTILRTVLIAAFATAATAQPPAGTITLANGSTVAGKVIEIIPAQVVIETPSGKITMPAAKLSQAWREAHLPGDIQLAKIKRDVENLRASYTEIKALAAQAGLVVDDAPALPALPATAKDGELVIGKISAKKTESLAGSVFVSWLVPLHNGTPDDMRLKVRFIALDKEGFEQWDDHEWAVKIKAGERVNVTKRALVDAGAWARTVGYRAKTEAAR